MALAHFSIILRYYYSLTISKSLMTRLSLATKVIELMASLWAGFYF